MALCRRLSKYSPVVAVGLVTWFLLSGVASVVEVPGATHGLHSVMGDSASAAISDATSAIPSKGPGADLAPSTLESDGGDSTSPAPILGPLGWETVNMTPWKVVDLPVFFFYGGAWCPYCASSSWSMYAALEAFGNFSGNATLGYSSPTDIYPSTPEVVLAGWNYSSAWVSLQAVESNFTSDTLPPTTNANQTFYVDTYAGNSIPFVVVNGQFIHADNALTYPADLQPWAGTGAQTVLSEVTGQNGSAWSLIESQAFLMQAMLLEANDGRGPASVVSNPEVQGWLIQLEESEPHKIAFTETGLPGGTSWSVSVNGATYTNSTSTITVTGVAGAYTYSVGAVAGYTATPGSGTVTVTTSDVSVPINFTANSSATTPGSSSGLSYTDWAILGVDIVLVDAVIVVALVQRGRARSGTSAP